MLKLNPNPTFDAEVRITVPGQAETESITLTFKYIPKKELQDFFKSHQAVFDKKGKLIKPASSDDAMLSEIIVGWGGVEVEYTRENLKVLLNNYHAAASDIIAGYVKALAESRAKN